MTINRENMIDKIRALMSKTMDNGCTEAEAMLALEKARALMDAYEVTDEDLALTAAEKAVLHNTQATDENRIRWALFHRVAEFAGCKGWFNGRPTDGRLTFCGLPSDIAFATWLLDTLEAFVRAELATHLMATRPVGRSDRIRVINGFVMGCTGRISRRLREMISQSEAVATGNGRALMVTKTALVDAVLRDAGIKLRSRSGSDRVADPASIHAGRAAGERASFGRPVSGAGAVLRIGSK